MIKPRKQNLLHHLGIAAGLTGLTLWFFAARELGILDWAAQLVPQGYAGASLMLSIMIVMTPAFGLWTLFNRWLERRLQIQGRYLEDEYYSSLNSDCPSDDKR